MKDNLTTLVTEHRNVQQQMHIPFLPPPPPLRLSQQKPSLEPTPSYSSLEQNYIAAKNAAAMMKLQATLNIPSSTAKV